MAENITIGIVGAGLAGLSCAYYLEKLGYSPVIFEKNSKVGGRCATESSDGYLFDQGFQVLMTSYNEIKKIIRLYEMDLKRFPSGAAVYDGKGWHELYNPLKHPFSIFDIRKIPFAFFSDYVKMGSLYVKSSFRTGDPFFRSIGKTTAEFIAEHKLSPPFVDKFMRPFFSGIFLDQELATNPGIFQWMLHFFVEGVAALPRHGMGSVPRLLAKKLEKTTIRLEHTVRALEGRSIFLQGGEEIRCKKIILAVDALQAKQLITTLPELKSKGVTTLYYAIDSDDLRRPPSPLLHLNGTHEGPINNFALVSVVQPSYAPKRKILVSANVIDPAWQTNPDLIQTGLEQLAQWQDTPSNKWEFLKRYTIPHALPDQRDPPPLQGRYAVDRTPDIYLCGEYVDHASLNGACASGRKVAHAIHDALQLEGHRS